MSPPSFSIKIISVNVLSFRVFVLPSFFTTRSTASGSVRTLSCRMETSENALFVKPNFDELTFQLNVTSPQNVRRITHNWISQQGNAGEQLCGISDIFELAGQHSEGLNEVILEAWGMLTEGGAWQARFSSREAAIRALNGPLLQDMRRRAQSSRGRKSKYAKTISRIWSEAVKDCNFEKFGENYLGNLAGVVEKYSFKKQ